jgi:hypothetical protein
MTVPYDLYRIARNRLQDALRAAVGEAEADRLLKDYDKQHRAETLKITYEAWCAEFGDVAVRGRTLGERNAAAWIRSAAAQDEVLRHADLSTINGILRATQETHE